MNVNERTAAAIALKPVDRVPNAPFYEAPVCRYFGKNFRATLREDFAMTDVHLQGVEALGMGLIGGIIPEAN
jgi:hypothetical protein